MRGREGDEDVEACICVVSSPVLSGSFVPRVSARGLGVVCYDGE